MEGNDIIDFIRDEKLKNFLTKNENEKMKGF